MFQDKTFQVALFVSALFHVALLFQTPPFEIEINKSLKQLEVTYQNIKSLPSEVKLLDPQDKKYQNKIQVVKSIPKDLPSFLKDNFSVKNFKLVQDKPKASKVSSQEKKKVTPKLDSKMDNNPMYKNYYEMIRENIKKEAYRNYTKYEEGEVYLSFVISQEGQLLDINLFKEKSKASEFLQNIALKSVKNAGPYPKFPTELNYPKLTFNVIISFELDN